tara:strand:- start:376 stop:591 length:216 start_codon:yes stop_codon:yes gene_type:complete
MINQNLSDKKRGKFASQTISFFSSDGKNAITGRRNTANGIGRYQTPQRIGKSKHRVKERVTESIIGAVPCS